MTECAREIIWSPAFSTGVAEIDSQHQTLLDILNALIRAGRQEMSERRTRNLLWQKFGELNEYAAFHFLSEEKLMQEHAPTETATARHIAQHRNYWVTVSEFKDRYQAGDDQVLGDLTGFLATWWVEHIRGTDVQLGHELTLKGVR